MGIWRQNIPLGVVSFFAGAAALSLFSIPQKIVLGADPYSLKGFAVPILFGGCMGLLIRFFYQRRLENLSKSFDGNKLETSLGIFTKAEHIARVGHWDWNLENDEIYCSDEMLRIFGFKDNRQGFTFPVFLDLIHPNDRDTVKKSIKDAIKNTAPFIQEFRFSLNDGIERTVNARGQVSHNTSGRTHHFTGVIRDITERKRVETALAEKIRELDFQKSALDQHAIVSTTNVQGTITYVNDKFCQISGYSRDELLGQNHRIVKSDEHSPEVFDRMWKKISNGEVWHGEVKNKTKEGGYYWVDATIVPFLNEKGKPFQYISIRTDITKRKRAEEKIRESEERFRKIYQIIPDIFMISRLEDGLCMDVNEGFTKFTGFSREEVVGKKTSNLNLWADLNDRDILVKKLKKAGYIINFAGIFHNKDRSTYVGLMSACIINIDDVPYIISTTKDVTEIREAQENAENANKAKSTFLSSMSHELRTPLNAILGFGQMLNSNPKEPLSSQQKICTNHILTAGDHLLELINDILDLAKIDSGKVRITYEDFQTSDLIDDVCSLVHGLAQERRIEIETPVIESSFQTNGDFTRSKQILLNLVSNAVKYNRKGGKVTIDCQRQDNSRLKISVTDTGEGIPAPLQEGLFQPFNRLGAENSEIEGSGIGLVVSKQLVELMGGNIGFDSKVGQGTTFWFDLPLNKPEAN